MVNGSPSRKDAFPWLGSGFTWHGERVPLAEGHVPRGTGARSPCKESEVFSRSHRFAFLRDAPLYGHVAGNCAPTLPPLVPGIVPVTVWPSASVSVTG